MRFLRWIFIVVFLFVGFAAAGLMLLPKERIAKVASAERSGRRSGGFCDMTLL